MTPARPLTPAKHYVLVRGSSHQIWICFYYIDKDLLKRGEGQKNQPFPYVTGWGSTEPRIAKDGRPVKTSSILQQLAIPLKGRKTCARSLEDVNLVDSFTVRMMCAGYTAGEETESGEVIDFTGQRDSCEGDSGGPLVRSREINGENIYYQIGIVSWGVGCAQRGKYGFYTHVPMVVDWVNNKTASIP